MKTHSIYRLTDGVFTGQRVSGDVGFMLSHLPAGYGYREGEFDHDKVRIDLVSMEVVPYKSPPPPNNLFITYEWSEEQWAWLPVKTDEALAFEAKERRSQLLAESDWVTARAVERGEPVPREWADYREALRNVTKQPGFPRDITWPVPPT